MENFNPISQYSTSDGSRARSWPISWPISWLVAASLSIALHGGLIFAAVANAPGAAEKRPETKIELLSIPTQKIESRIEQLRVNPLIEKELQRLSADTRNINPQKTIKTAALSDQVIRELARIEPSDATTVSNQVSEKLARIEPSDTAALSNDISEEPVRIEPRNADAAEAVNELPERIKPRIDTDKALQSVKTDRSQSTTPAIPDYSSVSFLDEATRMESARVSSAISSTARR